MQTPYESSNSPGRLVPRKSAVVNLVVFVSVLVNSMTLGYDGNMMNGLMILPSFSDYMHLSTATMAASSTIIWVGSAAVSPFGGILLDKFGRKNGILLAAVISLTGIALQSAAQNVAVFIVGRFILGCGVGLSSIACPTYASEVAPTKYRPLMLGFYYDIWYFGGMVAAIITYGTSQIDSTWSWRLPSLFQVIPSFLCLAMLPLIPESPRWLIAQGEHEKALHVLAATMANGDITDDDVLGAYDQICSTIAYEKENPASQNWLQGIKLPSNRKRVMLAVSVAIIGNLSGSAIASYWLGTMLSQAGVTDTYSQLQINIALNVWCFACAVAGTLLADKIGRKPLGIGSLAFALIFLYLVGIFTKMYGSSTDTSAVYGTVACIFFFQGGYSFGWTTLLVMYPTEVLNFSLRANGMSIYTFTSNSASVFATFIMPFALESIGWKMYIINASWDILEVLFVAFFWVETRRKSLEEIDALFGSSSYLNVEATIEGHELKCPRTSTQADEAESKK
ncbi:MFS sugar transporter [Fusarium circinatum]|uniref:MFS sugar transporter n=1 Tax=Fusarium circinatum TaxID=48490 RepID=A0A8H5WVG5_FUSCI|nr:MFS sugar transporter [Fusarium circinatum]